MVGEFAKRREIMLRGLRAIKGVSVAEPLGAFYLFPNIKAFGKRMSSRNLADYLLNEYGIADSRRQASSATQAKAISGSHIPVRQQNAKKAWRDSLLP